MAFFDLGECGCLVLSDLDFLKFKKFYILFYHHRHVPALFSNKKVASLNIHNHIHTQPMALKLHFIYVLTVEQFCQNRTIFHKYIQL